MNADEAGFVAAGRAVDAFGPDGGEGGKGARFNEAAIFRRHGAGDLHGRGGDGGGQVKGFELSNGRDDVLGHEDLFQNGAGGLVSAA